MRVGHEWTGSRSGLVAQIGMDLTYNVRITPGFERHLELDPMTNAFTRGPPAASASRTASAFSLHRVRGFEYRVMLASTMELKNCFALALDRQF